LAFLTAAVAPTISGGGSIGAPGFLRFLAVLIVVVVVVVSGATGESSPTLIYFRGVAEEEEGTSSLLLLRVLICCGGGTFRLIELLMVLCAGTRLDRVESAVFPVDMLLSIGMAMRPWGGDVTWLGTRVSESRCLVMRELVRGKLSPGGPLLFSFSALRCLSDKQ
jgi:hypothetical protein